MHPPTGAAWLVWLDTLAVAVAMRQWLWLYPIVEILHIVGFVTLVGAAIMFDLRLLGVPRPPPVTGMERHLLRAARLSPPPVVPSGFLMFAAHATEYGLDTPAFRLKLGLLLAAARERRRLPPRSLPLRGRVGSDTRRRPLAARVAAVASITLWVGVIACGRLIAYF